MIWKVWRNETIPILGLLVALVGLFANRLSILLVGLFFWGLTILASRLARRTLEEMTVTTHLTEAYAEIGASVLTELVVINPLPWPILDVQWKIDLPQAVHPEGAGRTVAHPGGARQTLAGTLWVHGHQRVRIQFRLTGASRGRWNIGPSSLTFKDPLSWNELARDDDSLYHLTVWPRRYPLPAAFWAQTPLMGPVRGKPWDTPDPLRITGVRPYRPGDPVRLMAPYASARLRSLMVKQVEPVQDRTVEVLLHPKTTDAHWHGIDRPLLEDTISIAASVVESAVLSGFATGLSSSGAVPGHIRGFTLPAQRRADARELLTALAWTQPSGTMDDDLPHVLARMQSRLKPGTILVVVSPYWPDVLTESLQAAQRRGLRVAYLTLGGQHPRVPHWIHDYWRFDQGRWSHA